MRRRLIVLLVSSSVIATLFTTSASALKPVPTFTVEQSWSGCDVTVTVRWSGYPGRVSASAGATDNASGSDATGTSPVSGRSGSFSHTFSYYAATTRTYDWSGIGVLARDRGTEILVGPVFTSRETHACSRFQGE